MKIFSAAQIRACDAYTIHASAITSLELMERAAAGCCRVITELYDRSRAFVILCGMGNNGGDGLVLARMLHQQGYGVKAFVVRHHAEFSPDCYSSLQRLQECGKDLVSLVEPGSYITDVPGEVILVDALFGTGLNRPPEGWIAAFIEHIDRLSNFKIALDMPSGLPADTVPEQGICAVRADLTLSFQFYKRAFLHPETGIYAGSVRVVDIGLDPNFIASTHTHYHVATPALVRSFYRVRSAFAHKGTFGTARIAAGSHGMTGAALLAVKAALRSGAGKVVATVPGCAYQLMQGGVPEALCTVSGDRYMHDLSSRFDADAIGVGPGLGTEEVTADGLASLLAKSVKPLVLDADALNILARRKDLLTKIPGGSILTPHPAEFDRLFGESANSMNRVERARSLAMRYNCVLIVKGRYTAICTSEGNCWYNVTGNPGMATAGSGDVLTGMLTALLAQGYEPEPAALTGVYLHGLAGDMALKTQSCESLTASDIIAHIGMAFRSLQHG